MSKKRREENKAKNLLQFGILTCKILVFYIQGKRERRKKEKEISLGAFFLSLHSVYYLLCGLSFSQVPRPRLEERELIWPFLLPC